MAAEEDTENLAVRILTAEKITTPKTTMVYKIEVSVTGSAWTVAKRYSELLALHNLLKKDGELSPLPDFPPKRAIGAMKPEFVDQRRTALNRYLQTLIQTETARCHPDLRSFLGLDPVKRVEEVVDEAATKWMEDWESLEVLCDSISSDLVTRQETALRDEDNDITRISATIRLKLNNLTQGLCDVGASLDGLPVAEKEKAQRYDMLMSLTARKDGLVEKLRAPLQKPSGETVVIDPVSQRRRQGWGLQETAETKNLNNSELLALQDHIMQDQDSGLDKLSEVLERQMQIASTINNELDLQNHMLDDLTANVDRTKASLDRENRKVERLL